MNKRARVILISIGIIFLLLILMGISYNVWLKYQTGNLNVISEREEIFYEIKETGNTYVGNQNISNLKKGFYNIYAYGILEDLYYPNTFEVEIKGNKTTDLEIKLERNPNSADVSGVEGP